MRLVERVKRGVIARLARTLDADSAKSSTASHVTLHPGATLLPESSVENLTGDPSNIEIGSNSYVRGRLLTYAHGGRIRIGEWCYIGIRTELWSMESIEIGDRVLISHGVNIHDGTAHSANPVERHDHFRNMILKGHPLTADELPGVHSAPVVIEDDVWISFGVTILRGVRIGKGSIIAAGATVANDVPPGVLYRCSITPQLTPLND